MGKTNIGKDLTVGRLTPALLRFAGPIMVANLLQTMYSMVDMAVIGQFGGSAGLSAVSAAGDIMHFFTYVGMGFATAGQIMVAQYVGAGKREALNEVIGTLFTFVLLVGLGLGTAGVGLADVFLRLIHVPGAAYEGARGYVVCCSAGMVFIFGYNMISAILRGMGDARHPMLFIGFAAVLNTILDLVLVGRFGMGPLGAALATVIGQGSSFLLCLGYLYRHRKAFGFDFAPRSFRLSPRPLGLIVRLGVPVVLQTSAGSIALLFVSSFVNSYGVTASAVTGVGNKLNNVALIVANAMNTAGAASIGQSFGGGKTQRIRQTVGRVFLVVFLFESVLTAGILLFPREIFGLFNGDEAVLAMAKQYAPVAAVSFMGYSVRATSLAFINGLGQSRINFFMGLVEGFGLRIGLSYLLGMVLKLGLPGFWYGYALGSYGYGVVVLPYFWSGFWEKQRPVTER